MLDARCSMLDARVPIPEVTRFKPPHPAYPAPEVVQAAVTVLLKAKRPLLLAGRVGRSIAAWKNRIALAEVLGARVLTSLRTSAAFPSDHPLHAGPPIKFINAEYDAAIASTMVRGSR